MSANEHSNDSKGQLDEDLLKAVIDRCSKAETEYLSAMDKAHDTFMPIIKEWVKNGWKDAVLGLLAEAPPSIKALGYDELRRAELIDPPKLGGHVMVAEVCQRLVNERSRHRAEHPLELDGEHTPEDWENLIIKYAHLAAKEDGTGSTPVRQFLDGMETVGAVVIAAIEAAEIRKDKIDAGTNEMESWR